MSLNKFNLFQLNWVNTTDVFLFSQKLITIICIHIANMLECVCVKSVGV